MDSTLRKNFPIFDKNPHYVYLDSAATTHKPRSVIEALSRFYGEENATVHRAVYRGAVIASERYARARETVQRFLRAAHTDEIVFTRGTTASLNLVALSWGRTHLGPGDEIVVPEMEHHSNLVPWQMLAEHTGATIRWVPMEPGGTADVVGYITERTKLVALAHVSNVTGTVHPIRSVADKAHAVGAVVVVDGAQGPSHIPVDVQALGADFYAFSGHKCYGPTGIGILYGKRALLAAMPPIEGGGDMIEHVTLEKTTYAAPPLRFEAGTPIIGSAIGLAAALEFIESIGREKIAAFEAGLGGRLREGLQSVEGLRILGTAPKHAALATFVVDGVHPLDLATLLDLSGFAIRSGHLCAQPCLKKFGVEAAVRASLGVYNTLEEVERFVEALRRVVRKLRQ